MKTNQLLCNGKYRLVRVIGEGGYGAVWLADETASRAQVAIKIARRNDPDAEARFSREIFFSRKVHHPHLLRADTVELTDDERLLVFPFVAGGSLAQRLSDHEPRPLNEVLRVGQAIASALAYLHQRDVIHRDVHPGNILFEPDGTPLLTDLGLAQSADFSVSRQYGQKDEKHPGNMFYQPPEAIMPSPSARAVMPLYPAADVYMLGAVLWEMLTGKSYYLRGFQKRLPPSALRSDTSVWLDALIARCLAPETDERPENGEELERLLKAGEAEEHARNEKRKAEEQETREASRSQADEKAEREAKEKAEAERKHKETEEVEHRKQEAKSKKQAADKAEREAEERRARKLRAKEQEAEREAKEKAEAERKRKEAEELARRVAAQQIAATIKNPKFKIVALTLAPDVTMELIRVPAGEFVMGSDKAKDKLVYSENELPQHNLHLPEYLIGKAPVTVVQFAAFVKATRYVCDERTLRNLKRFGAHPVTNVFWKGVVAFCEWVSNLTDQHVRLPSEAEWEKAARGTDGRIWPWGNETPTDKHCNFDNKLKDTTPIGQYSPIGDSPYGCVDMAGNVWEWTSSLFKSYPYKVGDGREDCREDSRIGGVRVLRGGSFYPDEQFVRCAHRNWDLPHDLRRDNYGFRVCVLPVS